MERLTTRILYRLDMYVMPYNYVKPLHVSATNIIHTCTEHLALST